MPRELRTVDDVIADFLSRFPAETVIVLPVDIADGKSTRRTTEESDTTIGMSEDVVRG